MAYLNRPSYLGVGTLDVADRNAALVRRNAFALRYKNAFNSLKKLGPQAQATVLAQVRQTLNNLPPDTAKRVTTAASALVDAYDMRSPTGMGDGATAVASTASTIAGIASLVASLGTLGLGIAQFVENKKTSKQQREIADKQAADEAKANKQALALAQEQQRQVKTTFDAEQAAKAGYKMLPDGTVVENKSSSGLATAGAIAAAAVGAFFVTK
jgi:hypothetical protein